MNLVVLGVSARSLPVAAVASAMSGEVVTVTAEDADATIDLPVAGSNLSGQARILRAGQTDLSEAALFVVAATAANIRPTLEQYASAMKGKPVLLAPGGFAGALMAAHQFPDWVEAGTIFSEAPGWMFGGRIVDDHFRIAMRKYNLQVAAAQEEKTATVVELYSRYFPDIVPSDLVTTSLSNINPIIHPPLAIGNATRISQGEDWHLWDQGFTVEIARLIAAVDDERVRIVERLGGEAAPLLDLALAAYGPAGMSGDNYYDAVKSFAVYRGRPGEKKIDGPFLVDDVVYGVAAFEALARRLGVEHEVLSAVRLTAEVLLGRPLKADDVAIEALLDYAARRMERRASDQE